MSAHSRIRAAGFAPESSLLPELFVCRGGRKSSALNQIRNVMLGLSLGGLMDRINDYIRAEIPSVNDRVVRKWNSALGREVTMPKSNIVFLQIFILGRNQVTPVYQPITGINRPVDCWLSGTGQ